MFRVVECTDESTNAYNACVTIRLRPPRIIRPPSTVRADAVAGLVLLVWYFAGAAFFFYLVAEPALLRETFVRIGADSQTYIEIARYLELTGQFTLDNAVSLSFNYFGPVLLLLLTDYNHALIFAINTLVFALSLLALARHYEFHRFWFVALLLLNPITLLSLTTVNKEVLGLAGILYLFVYLRSGRPWHLVLAVGLAAMTRWQQVAFILILLPYLRFLRLDARLFTWGPILALMVASAVYPFVSHIFDFTGDTDAINIRNQYAQAGGLVPLLNRLQENFLYWIAFIPKALLNYVGNFPRVVRVFDPNDPADFYNRVLVGHQLAMLVLLVGITLRWRFRFRLLETQIILIYSILYCISLGISYRYFYPIYPMFALLLTLRSGGTHLTSGQWVPSYRFVWGEGKQS